MKIHPFFLLLLIICIFPAMGYADKTCIKKCLKPDKGKQTRINFMVDQYATRYNKSLQTGLNRSALYIGMIKDQKPKNFPEGIEYLPVVESNFHWRAKSKAKALGLWQFMESTAEENGLRVSMSVDERLNPVKSTKAAFKHLTRLYGIFKDWDLTLAAYNYGEGNLKKALQREKVKSFWELKNIPSETLNYVPAFHAVVKIIGNSKAYEFKLPKYKPIQLVKRYIPGNVSLIKVAHFINEDPENMLFWNGELKLGITPDEGWNITMPASFKTFFLHQLNAQN